MNGRYDREFTSNPPDPQNPPAGRGPPGENIAVCVTRDYVLYATVPRSAWNTPTPGALR